MHAPHGNNSQKRADIPKLPSRPSFRAGWVALFIFPLFLFPPAPHGHGFLLPFLSRFRPHTHPQVCPRQRNSTSTAVSDHWKLFEGGLTELQRTSASEGFIPGRVCISRLPQKLVKYFSRINIRPSLQKQCSQLTGKCLSCLAQRATGYDDRRMESAPQERKKRRKVLTSAQKSF